jgi:hypothetical protein
VCSSDLDAEEMETSGLYERLVSRFGGVFAGPPHCERYELSAQTESIRKE